MAMALGTIYETKLGSLKGTKGTGALLRDFSREVEVEMLPVAGENFLGTASTIIYNFCPAGAFNVWLTGRVVETVTVDPANTDEDLFCGVVTADEQSIPPNGVNTTDAQFYGPDYFGRNIAKTTGTTWGPAAVEDVDQPNFKGGYPHNDTDFFHAWQSRWWGMGFHLVFATGSFGELTGGRVRVCMFYQMLIAPPHRLGDPD